MKKLVLLLSAFALIGCGEKLPDDPEIKQALENAVKGEVFEWRDEKGLVIDEPPHLISESSARLHLRGESEPYSGWLKLTAEAVFMNGDYGHKETKDPEAVRGLLRVKGGHWEGRSVSWFRNGQIKSEGTFKQGKLDGLVRGWHENGQKASEETFKDGKRDGLSVGWDRNGSKTSEFIYKAEPRWVASPGEGGSLNWKEPLAESPLEYGPHKENKPFYARLVKGEGRPVVPVSITITDCDEKASGALTIPATIEGFPVTGIRRVAFENCASLTSITIPDSVTSIGGGSFGNCDSLTSIAIPEGVTSIGEFAFQNCTSLTSITIPSGVTSIGDRAFVGCKNLTAVTFLGDAPKITYLNRIAHRIFDYSGSLAAVYRKPEAKGWGKTFGGRPVKLISEKP